ncbi:MAG TPA: hypothetical protein VJR95_06050, partial [Rhodanobacter sp.]|nr:hypothetical protein [Rhodanobacter sp.]
MNLNPATRGISTIVALLLAGPASAQHFGPWSDPQPVSAINTPTAEGCPIESPSGLDLYIASNRSAPRAQGKLDIYRAHRATLQSDWGEPENLGPVVNSSEFDYCPTPLPGKWLLFVSSRQTADDCYPGNTPPPAPVGGPSAGDMYITRENPAHGWQEPVN